MLNNSLKLITSTKTTVLDMEHLDNPQAASWLDYITKEYPEDNTQSDSGTPTG